MRTDAAFTVEKTFDVICKRESEHEHGRKGRGCGKREKGDVEDYRGIQEGGRKAAIVSAPTFT